MRNHIRFLRIALLETTRLKTRKLLPRFFARRFNASGFSLVEMMVVMAVAGIMSAGLVEMNLWSVKSQSAMKWGYERINLHEEIRTLMGNAGACFNTFTSINMTPGLNKVVTAIRNPDNTVAYDTSTVYGPGKVRIQSMALDVSNAGGLTTGTLKIEYSTDLTVVGPSRLAGGLNTINLRIESSGASLTSCVATAKASDGLWVRAGNNVDIYYNAGNVGVGTTNPSLATFQVSTAGSASARAGGFFMPSLSNGNATSVAIGRTDGNNDAGVLRFTPNATATNSTFGIGFNGGSDLLTVRASGNIGIGTASPTNTLHIATGDPVLMVENVVASSNSVIKIRNPAQIWQMAVRGADLSSSFVLRNETSNADVLAVNTAGRLGVGITSPAYSLDVNGGIASGSGTSTATFSTPSNYFTGDAQLVLRSASQSAVIGLAGNTLSIATPNTWGPNVVMWGNLGIATTNPSDRLVVVSDGTTVGRYTTGGWTHTSDGRLKRNISPIESSLEKILKLQGVEFQFTSDPKQEKQLGFIAQDVEQVFPQVVQTDNEGFKTMAYGNLVAPLVEAVKDMFNRLIKTESRQKELDRQVASLKSSKAEQSQLQELKRENAHLKKQTELLINYICAKDSAASFCMQK
jgi:prepilin-type N-terminal cleavage/methylation domain-containing protein